MTEAPATTASITLRPRVKSVGVVLALLLLTPAVAGFFTDHGKRSQWEKRELTQWQAVLETVGGEQFFPTLESFIGDHMGFTLQLNGAYRMTLYYLYLMSVSAVMALFF